MKLTARLILSFLVAILFYAVLVFSDAPSIVPPFASVFVFIGVLTLTSRWFPKMMEEDRIHKQEIRENQRIRKEQLREIEEEEYRREKGRIEAQKNHELSHKPENYLKGLGSSPLADMMLEKKRRSK